ncbi:MAG: hypothetical protein V3T59_01100 [Desulfobacterales bacterium]
MLVSTIQVAQAGCVTVEGYLFAASEKLLDQAIKYHVRQNIEGVMSLANTGLVAMIHGGIRVYIEGESGIGQLRGHRSKSIRSRS